MCEVTTAKALDAAMTKEVEGALGAFLKKGEKALISYKVNQFLGGLPEVYREYFSMLNWYASVRLFFSFELALSTLLL